MGQGGSRLTRREFVSGIGVGLLAAPLLGCSAQTAKLAATVDRSRGRLPYTDGFGSMPCSKCIAPSTMSSSISLAGTEEPGERLVMSGTIFHPDGKTPAEGVVLYVYQTDVTGYYSKDDDPYNPRLRGWLKTGADGRYEFSTIKPAPYPHRDTPAHIHAQIFSDQIDEYCVDDYWFEGDRLITDRQKRLLLNGRGGPGSIVRLTRDGSTLRGLRDIRLDVTT